MWTPAQSPKPEAIQRSLFLDLNEEESRIVELLAKQEEGVHINTLVAEANMPINRISPILFELELRGIVRPLVGSIYKLIR
jgi:DNA processing protein